MALDAFVAEFRSESDRAYYIFEASPIVKSTNKFSFTVQIRRRTPDMHKRELKVDP